MDDRSRAAGRFRKAETFLKRLLRENVGERCDKLLRGIRESHSPKSVHSPSSRSVLRSPRSRKRDIKDSPLSPKEDTRESALLDNKSDQQGSILEEEEEAGGRRDSRRNLKEAIQRSPSSPEEGNGESTLDEKSSLPLPRKSNRPNALPPDSNDQRRLPSEKEGANVKKDIREDPSLLEQNDRASPLLSKENNTSIGQLMRLAGNATQEKTKFLPKSILEERSFLLKKDFEGTLGACLLPGKADCIPLLQPAEKTVQDNPPSTKDHCSSTITEETEDRVKPVAPLRLKRTTGSNQPTDRLSYGSAVVHRRRLSSENSQSALQGPKKTLREQRDRKLKRSPPPEEEEKEEKEKQEEEEEEEDRPGRESEGSDNGGLTDKRESKCGLAVSRRHAEPRQLIVKPLEEQITISERKKERIPSRARRLLDTSVEDSELDFIVRSTGSVSECLFNRTHNVRSPDRSSSPAIEANDLDNTRKDSVIEIEAAERSPERSVTKAAILTETSTRSPTESKVPERILNVSLVVTDPDYSFTAKVTRDPEASNSQRVNQKDPHKTSSSRKKHRPGNPANPRASFIRSKPTDSGRMKLKVRLIRIRDRFVLALSAFAILFTLLLVMDLQMDLGYSGHHLVASHGRIKLGDQPDADTVYNNFRRKFLQRMNGSREQADATPSIVEKSGKADTTPPPSSSSSSTARKDEFPDLVDLVVNGYGVNVDEGVARISGEDHEYNPTIGELRKVALR